MSSSSPSPSVAPSITDEDRDALARATVSYVWEKSAFYRARLQAEGVQPGDISGVDDLERVPILLRKDDERELQERSRAELGHPFGEHLCVDPAEVVAVASTSGTTGTPTFYAFTAEDVAVTDELWGRALRQAGVGAGDGRPPGFRVVDVPRRLSAAAGGRADGRSDHSGRRRGGYPAPAEHRCAGSSPGADVHPELRQLPDRAAGRHDARARPTLDHLRRRTRCGIARTAVPDRAGDRCHRVRLPGRGPRNQQRFRRSLALRRDDRARRRLLGPAVVGFRYQCPGADP